MDIAAAGAVQPESLFAGFCIQEESRVGKGSGDGLQFFGDVAGSGLVHPQHDGTFFYRVAFRAAEVVNAGAGGVGDGELVHHEPRAVEQSVEGKVVQEVVGGDDQAPAGEFGAYGGKQLVVEFAQMLEGGLTHLPGE